MAGRRWKKEWSKPVKVLTDLEQILNSKEKEIHVKLSGTPSGIVWGPSSNPHHYDLFFHISGMTFYKYGLDSLRYASELKAAQETNQKVTINGIYYKNKDYVFVNRIKTTIKRLRKK